MGEGGGCLICWLREWALMQGRVLIKVRGVIRGITRHGVQSILIFQMIQGSSVFKETNEKCGSLDTTKNN